MLTTAPAASIGSHEPICARLSQHRKITAAEAQSDRGIDVSAPEKAESQSDIHLREHSSEIESPLRCKPPAPKCRSRREASSKSVRARIGTRCNNSISVSKYSIRVTTPRIRARDCIRPMRRARQSPSSTTRTYGPGSSVGSVTSTHDRLIVAQPPAPAGNRRGPPIRRGQPCGANITA